MMFFFSDAGAAVANVVNAASAMETTAGSNHAWERGRAVRPFQDAGETPAVPGVPGSSVGRGPGALMLFAFCRPWPLVRMAARPSPPISDNPSLRAPNARPVRGVSPADPLRGCASLLDRPRDCRVP